VILVPHRLRSEGKIAAFAVSDSHIETGAKCKIIVGKAKKEEEP
jgi:hypothetical protein